MAGGFPDTIAFNVEESNRVQVKLKAIDIPQKEVLIAAIENEFGEFEELSYRSIGPSIGTEVSRAAILAVALASLLIMLYIAFAFRSVSHPFRYGTCAVIALIHDVLVTVTFTGIMFFVGGWEVDALFLTAILTVIGFSVNDTIVVFDRLRENLRRLSWRIVCDRRQPQYCRDGTTFYRYAGHGVADSCGHFGSGRRHLAPVHGNHDCRSGLWYVQFYLQRHAAAGRLGRGFLLWAKQEEEVGRQRL